MVNRNSIDKVIFLFLLVCLFFNCQLRWSEVHYDYPEDLSGFYYYADGWTQSGIFKIEHINDSVYAHVFYDLSKKLSQTVKKEDGSTYTDTFKLTDGKLYTKHLGEFHILINNNSFEEKRDTFCDIRNYYYVCYAPCSAYCNGVDSVYVYGPSHYSYKENFGIEFIPNKGIVAYRDGPDTLRLQKVYPNGR